MDSQPENPLEDAALMAATREGDMQAFAQLVRRHQRGLVNFFVRMGASSDAEDLAQETFVRLYKYRDRYTPSARFTTFLFTLGRHAWCDTLRQWQRRDKGLTRLRSETAIREDERHEAKNGRAEAVRAAVERLPDKLRLVMVLSVYEGFDYETIGQMAGIPVGTVKSRVFLAMQRLKEWLNHDPARDALS
jgi:RNA polymerase sigma-70 factor (ECF subfamily)